MLSYTHFTHDERISLHNFLKKASAYARSLVGSAEIRPRSAAKSNATAAQRATITGALRF